MIFIALKVLYKHLVKAYSESLVMGGNPNFLGIRVGGNDNFRAI